MALTDTIKDAAYVTIGLGVLGFQKAQVRRVELTKQLEEQLSDGRKSFAGLATQLEGYVAPVRTQIESQLDSIEAALPVQVQDIVKQARTAAHQTEETLRQRLGLAA